MGERGRGVWGAVGAAALVICAACGDNGGEVTGRGSVPPSRNTPVRAAPCEQSDAPDLDVATEPDWRRYGDYRDWTRNGCLVRIDVLADRYGAEHCGNESVRVIITGSPLGTRHSGVDDSVEYIRDPLDVFGLATQLDLDAILPTGAVDSGYRSGDTELWIDPADASAIFIVDGERIERWPAGQETLCD